MSTKIHQCISHLQLHFVNNSCTVIYDCKCVLQSHFKDVGKAPADEPVIHRIRITLTSRSVKSLEKGKTLFFVSFIACL